MNISREVYTQLVEDSCKLEKVKIPTPEQLLLASMFGPEPVVVKYRQFLTRLHNEMKESGIDGVTDAEGNVISVGFGL